MTVYMGWVDDLCNFEPMVLEYQEQVVQTVDGGDVFAAVQVCVDCTQSLILTAPSLSHIKLTAQFII